MHIDVVQHVQNRPHWFSIGFLKCGCARLYVRGVSRISIERLYKACCHAMWFNLNAFGSARHVSILHTRPVGHRYTCYHAIWSQNRCAVTASVQLRCATFAQRGAKPTALVLYRFSEMWVRAPICARCFQDFYRAFI